MSEQPLDRAYELTEAMSAAASAGDWLRAAQLAEERSPFIMSLTANQPPEAMAKIRAIQQFDAAITGHATAGRDVMTNQLGDALTRIAAAGFYQQTGKL
jgi:hypothetical protein